MRVPGSVKLGSVAAALLTVGVLVENGRPIRPEAAAKVEDSKKTIRREHITNADIAAQIAPATGTVMGRFINGAAFFIKARDRNGNEKFLVLTNDHIAIFRQSLTLEHMDGTKEIINGADKNTHDKNGYLIALYNGNDFEYTRAVRAKFVASAPILDLAILELEPGVQVPTLPLGNFLKIPVVGDECHTFGFGEGGERDRYSAGYVSHTMRKSRNKEGISLEVRASLNPGNSGSPLCIVRRDEYGHPVFMGVGGVAYGGNTRLNNVGYGTDIFDLKMFLERNGYRVLDSDEQGVKREITLEALRDYVHPVPFGGTASLLSPIITAGRNEKSYREIEFNTHKLVAQKRNDKVLKVTKK